MFQYKNSNNHDDDTIRVSTDGYFLMLHFFFLCGLGGLLTYCVFNGDIQRITVGYDNCKNICGIRNYVPDNLKRSDCEALDLISRPYLLIFKPDEWNYTYNATYTGVRAYDVGVSLTLSTDVSRLCVTSCRMYPHYEQYKSKCVLKKRKEVANRFFGKSGIPNFIVEVAEDLAVCWETILYIEFGCFVLSYIITTLLGFQPKAMLWLLLSTAVVLCSVFTIYMWILFGETIQYISQQDYLPSTIELQRNKTYLIFALIGTFVVVPLLFYIILKNRKKMIGCVQLYKETFKALTAMPMMFTLPILSFVFVSAIIAGWIYGSIWIESSGNPKLQRPDYFIFVKSSWNFSARWVNLIGCFWTIMFILDCQHMVVAGATSFWYFCRDKNNLGVPIFYALYNLLRYHLGSVSLGSLIAFVTEIPRIIFGLIERLSKVQNGRFAVKCCLHRKDSVLKYSTRDAYIEVALYGCSFRFGGRKAFKTITSNDFGMTSVRKMGIMVLNFASFSVCTIAVLTGTVILQEYEELLHLWVILILIGIFAYFVSTCSFSLYQSSMDTILLCFCEDYEHCDGLSQAYFMSKELLQFAINSKQVIFE